jgi:signal transduction histidine kinase
MPSLSAPVSRPMTDTETRAVIATDASGVIRHLSWGAEELLGHGAEALVGRSLRDVHVPGELETRARELGFGGIDGLEAVFAGVRGGRVPYERQRWTYVCEDSTRMRVNTTVTPVYGGVDEVIAFVILLETPQLVLEPETSTAWPARLARVGDDYAASVSHELRTPIAIILGYLEFLQSQDAGPLTDPQRAMLEKVEHNTNRVLDMVQSMLRQYPAAVDHP